MGLPLDQQEYIATCGVFGIHPHSCAGSEEVLLGAMRGLIAFRVLSPQARMKWDLACTRAGSQPAAWGLPSRSAIAWMILYQMRQDAFEFATDNDSVLKADVGVFPWAQSRQEFANNQLALSENRSPHTSPPEPSELKDMLEKYQSWTGVILYFLKYGGVALANLARSSVAVIEATNVWIDFALVFVPPAAAGASYLISKANVSNCKPVYAIDSRRRALVGETPLIATKASSN